MNIEVVIPILNDEYKVIVMWGNLKYIKKKAKSWHHDTLSDEEMDFKNRRGMCLYKKDCHPVIILPRKPKTAQEIGTLSHEAVHAVEDIFIKIQQPTNGEVFAHSVGAVIRCTLERR